MNPIEALKADSLTLAIAVLQDRSLEELKAKLSEALRLPLDSVEDLYQLSPRKFVLASQRIVKAVKNHLFALLVKMNYEFCHKFNYCNKRNLPISILVEDLGKILSITIPSAPNEAGAIIAVAQFLDAICGCSVSV